MILNYIFNGLLGIQNRLRTQKMSSREQKFGEQNLENTSNQQR